MKRVAMAGILLLSAGFVFGVDLDTVMTANGQNYAALHSILLKLGIHSQTHYAPTFDEFAKNTLQSPHGRVYSEAMWRAIYNHHLNQTLKGTKTIDWVHDRMRYEVADTLTPEAAAKQYGLQPPENLSVSTKYVWISVDNRTWLWSPDTAHIRVSEEQDMFDRQRECMLLGMLPKVLDKTKYPNVSVSEKGGSITLALEGPIFSAKCEMDPKVDLHLTAIDILRNKEAGMSYRLSEYKQVNGIFIPFHCKVTRSNGDFEDIRVTEVKVNAPLSDDLWAPPAGAEIYPASKPSP